MCTEEITMRAATDSRTARSNKAHALYSKLELAIREVLFRYNGVYEESLADWFLALRLTVPELEHPRELADVFQRLVETETIEIHRNGVVLNKSSDESFFLRGPFTV